MTAIARYEGHLDLVKTLIEAGANVNHTNEVGKHCCCTSWRHALLYNSTVLRSQNISIWP